MNVKKEMFRFLIAGTFVFAVDLGTYFFLIHFLLFSIAKGIAFICAGIVAYLLNKNWVFKYNQLSSYREVVRYLIINFLALGINVLINQSILNMWPNAILFALIIASMCTGLLTFICYKWWVFKIQSRDVSTLSAYF